MSGSIVVISGCAEDSSGDSSNQSETEASCQEKFSEQYCETLDFARAVEDRLESLSGTPEVIDAGVYITGDDETIDDRALMFIHPETADFESLAEDVGFVAGAFAYHIEDYDVRRMDVRVYADSEAEDYRGKFHIKDEWAEARLNEELTSEEYVTTVMDTTVPAD